MTTIQTAPTSRSQSNDALRGAGAAPKGAAHAPGFSQLLDNQLATIEPTDESRVDEAREDNPDDAGADEAHAEKNEQAQQDKQAAAENDAQAQDDQDPGREPVFDPKLLHASQVRSARDLGVILNNAAQIDLSRISAQELATAPARPDTAPKTPEHLQREPLAQHAAQHPTAKRESVAPHANQAPSGSGQPEQRAAPSDTPRIPLPERAAPEPTNQSQPVQIAAQSAAMSVAPVTTAPAAPGPATGAPIASVGAVTSVQATSSSANSSGNGAAFDLGAQDRPQILKAMDAKSTDPHAALKDRIVNQVSRSLASVLKEGGGSMTMRLTPEHLGEVHIKLVMRDGVVRARIETRSDDASKLLQEGLPQLRAALEARGVRVEELSIQQGSTADDSASDPGFNPDSDASQSDQRDRGDRERQDTQHHPEDGTDPIEAGDPRRTDSIWTHLGLDAIA